MFDDERDACVVVHLRVADRPRREETCASSEGETVQKSGEGVSVDNVRLKVLGYRF